MDISKNQWRSTGGREDYIFVTGQNLKKQVWSTILKSFLDFFFHLQMILESTTVLHPLLGKWAQDRSDSGIICILKKSKNDLRVVPQNFFFKFLASNYRLPLWQTIPFFSYQFWTKILLCFVHLSLQ